ncbi:MULTISPECIES: hypothetical protein [Paenibacillus]|uniref:hypothetical protein n=1 Tax=Paenibacillus TaxID=44249 RepID=UPI00077C717A|nr:MULTISPECIES: hypothetical protein [Paenibacillus]KAF6637711.1 hypothetical protein H6F38_02390 [Paenibacillus sp. EKM208P]KYG95526.1 hypothetical protein AZE31_17260 [Paenibacillus polymyxa]OMF42428.1 hypothetical protein BK135_19770 [Paenibacillus peoriae]QYK61726.1 hypothetical protein KAI37_02050 [Paenibacillus sp. S25]
MNLLFIPGLYFYIYLGIGLIVGYWFVSKELTERAQEMQQENQEENDEELSTAREGLYQSLHDLYHLIGQKGVIAAIYILFMLFWLPMWLVITWKRLFTKKIKGD